MKTFMTMEHSVWCCNQSGVALLVQEKLDIALWESCKKWFEVVNFEKYFSTDVQQKFDYFEGRCINIQNFVIQMGLIFFVKINIVKFATTKKV